jgi:hypothetical protein
VGFIRGRLFSPAILGLLDDILVKIALPATVVYL